VDWVRFDAVAGMAYAFDMAASSGTDLAWTIFAPTAPAAAPESVGEALAAGLAGRTIWRAAVTGVHLLEIKERTGKGGLGFSYTLAVTALDRRVYLPLVMSSTVQAASRAVGRAVADRAEDQPPAGVQALAFDARSGDLYIVGQDTLARYDPTGRQVLAQTRVGQEPGGLVLDAARGRVYIASGEQGALLALDARTLALIAAVGGFAQPGGAALAGDQVFVADTQAGVVRAIAADDFRVTAVTEVGPGPYALAALPAQGRVFVAQSGGDSIAWLDAATGGLAGVTALDGLGHPQGMVADAQAGKVYVIYMLSPRYRQIAVLDGLSGAVERIIPATLDRPLTFAAALALDAARGRLLVGDSTGILAYDLAANTWADAPVADARGPAPIFGLAVDPANATLFTRSLADRAGRLQRLDAQR